MQWWLLAIHWHSCYYALMILIYKYAFNYHVILKPIWKLISAWHDLFTFEHQTDPIFFRFGAQILISLFQRFEESMELVPICQRVFWWCVFPRTSSCYYDIFDNNNVLRTTYKRRWSDEYVTCDGQTWNHIIS